MKQLAIVVLITSFAFVVKYLMRMLSGLKQHYVNLTECLFHLLLILPLIPFVRSSNFLETLKLSLCLDTCT